ncbi:hypothetical protein GGI42DRAFT_353371 [Trichoderma sp. SZMC 28013]
MSAPAIPATDYQVLWDTIHSLVDEQKERIDALEKEVRDLKAQLQQQQQQRQTTLPRRPAAAQEDASSAPPAPVVAVMAESSADPAPATTTTTTATTTSTEVAVLPAPTAAAAAAAQKRPGAPPVCYGCGEPGHVDKSVDALHSAPPYA